MKLVEITDSHPWEAFHATQPWTHFLQSWAWGEFRASRGVPIKRFALIDDSGAWLAAAQMEYRPKKLVGGYWFAPRGPVFSSRLTADDTRNVFHAFLDRLKDMKLARSLFLRFEPAVELGKPEGMTTMAMRRNDAQNPASTIILNLEPSQEALLAKMHPKTRYNIRVAAKHGVTTRLATHPDDVKTFLDLMDETAKRDGFVQHDRIYLEATYRFLESKNMARIRIAEQNGMALAANFEILCGNTVTYLYGSSSSASREVMAPYALHWDAISMAKRDGFTNYDFWGANPESKAAFAYKPSWEGITRFKRGWGGRQVDLYGSWDLPHILPLYRLAFMRHFLRG
ncbi:MAG: peptidoglycan bridge formation glycyltransferase FemA/FemB family protein [Patescibacteria group bacterium]|jgi:lipid II:glycine glycyltransferase (peptidoglycan interpeptide bridge formation enzyme)